MMSYYPWAVCHWAVLTTVSYSSLHPTTYLYTASSPPAPHTHTARLAPTQVPHHWHTQLLGMLVCRDYFLPCPMYGRVWMIVQRASIPEALCVPAMMHQYVLALSLTWRDPLVILSIAQRRFNTFQYERMLRTCYSKGYTFLDWHARNSTDHFEEEMGKVRILPTLHLPPVRMVGHVAVVTLLSIVTVHTVLRWIWINRCLWYQCVLWCCLFFSYKKWVSS